MATFLFYMPVLLSGFMFPIENMPVIFQYLTYANPLRYFLVIIRGIFLKGNGIGILWPQMSALLVLGGHRDHVKLAAVQETAGIKKYTPNFAVCAIFKVFNIIIHE